MTSQSGSEAGAGSERPITAGCHRPYGGCESSRKGPHAAPTLQGT
jgi:hypothetical protein